MSESESFHAFGVSSIELILKIKESEHVQTLVKDSGNHDLTSLSRRSSEEKESQLLNRRLFFEGLLMILPHCNLPRVAMTLTTK